MNDRTQTTTAVNLRGLEVRAGDKTLVGPLDLQLKVGEHLLVVGPSGSGKSTLLSAIAGLTAPHSGELQLFGQTASSGSQIQIPAAERQIGYLFQGGALWPHLNVAQTLDFVLGLRGLDKPKRPQRIAKLLTWVELEGMNDRTPGTLSGGEAQRLSLARALACEPKLLLLDEPLGPLDRNLREALIERLGWLTQELGLSTIHVTHDPEEASTLSDRTLDLGALSSN